MMPAKTPRYKTPGPIKPGSSYIMVTAGMRTVNPTVGKAVEQ